MNTIYHFIHRLRCAISYRLQLGKIHYFEDELDIELANIVLLNPNTKLNNLKLSVGLIKDTAPHPYYTKFRRFLECNNIHYNYLDIFSSSWMEDAKAFDAIIWRPMSLCWELEDAREKIYFLENNLQKSVYPSFNEVMFYENKIYQYYILKNEGFPIIETFISSNYDETICWAAQAKYPFVSKIKTGSASMGTKLIKNKDQAMRLIKKVFKSGKSTYWPSVKQKNYVFFQNYVENTGFDIRIIIIDENNIFGYFREVPGNDFRASGMNKIIKKEIPKEAIKIALDIAQQLGFTSITVDFLQSAKDSKFYIIEASIFIAVKTDEQLKVNGIPGRYKYNSHTDRLSFEEGKYWIQELILKRYFEKNLI